MVASFTSSVPYWRRNSQDRGSDRIPKPLYFDLYHVTELSSFRARATPVGDDDGAILSGMLPKSRRVT